MTLIERCLLASTREGDAGVTGDAAGGTEIRRVGKDGVEEFETIAVVEAHEWIFGTED